MTTLYLIRHAQSQFNVEAAHLIHGRSNHVPLSAHGLEQARILGQRFKQQPFNPDIWISSPAVRTLHTAKIVLEQMGIAPDLLVDDDVQELSHGDWEGLDRLNTYTAEILTEKEKNNWHFKSPNGESPFEVEQRMMGFATKCCALFPGQTIAVFTHCMAIACLLRPLLDRHPSPQHDIAFDNTGISVVSFDPVTKNWRVLTMNDHAHLV